MPGIARFDRPLEADDLDLVFAELEEDGVDLATDDDMARWLSTAKFPSIEDTIEYFGVERVVGSKADSLL